MRYHMRETRFLPRVTAEREPTLLDDFLEACIYAAALGLFLVAMAYYGYLTP